MQSIIIEKLTHYDLTSQKDNVSQTVRAKEKLSHGATSQRQASDTNSRMKALRHGRH